MSYNRNGQICLHNITETDPDTKEEYCLDCGDVIENEEDAN